MDGSVSHSGSADTKKTNTRVQLCLKTTTSKNIAVNCEHPVPRVGLIQNTCHYTRVRRQTIQLIMSCNVFIIPSLPFPSLAKLSNLTSQPYFRFRDVRNLKIDHSHRDYTQVEYLSNVLSSVLPYGRYQQKILLSVYRPYEMTAWYHHHVCLSVSQ
jgi:hypothetical protein